MICDPQERSFLSRCLAALVMSFCLVALVLAGCSDDGLVVDTPDGGSPGGTNHNEQTPPTNTSQGSADAGDLSDDVTTGALDTGQDPTPQEPDAGGLDDDVAPSQPDAGEEPQPSEPDTGSSADPDTGGEEPDAGLDLGEPECTYGVDAGCPLDCTFAEQWDDQWLSMAETTRTLVNQRRAQGATCGGQSFGPAQALPMHDALERASRCHSQDMQTNDFLATQGTDGSNGGDRAFAAGYPVGMVMSMVHGWHETPQEVVSSWMETASLCEVIMGPDWEHIGIAVAIQGGNEYSPHWTLKVGLNFE